MREIAVLMARVTLSRARSDSEPSCRGLPPSPVAAVSSRTRKSFSARSRLARSVSCHGFGFGEFLVEAGEALPVGGSGLLVEDVVGGCSGRVVQAVGVPLCWPGRGGRAGGGREPDQFHRGQLAAGVTDEQVQVPQAQAVRHAGDGVRVADEPEIVLPVQGDGALSWSGWSGWSRTASSLVMPQSAAMARASASAAEAAGRSRDLRAASAAARTRAGCARAWAGRQAAGGS